MKKVMKQNLSKLMEAELDKAETVLAVREMGDKIQGMTEDVAKMRVDTLMPLAETIKEQFGRDVGERFQQALDSILNDLQSKLTSTKDEIDNRVAVLNGDETDVAPEMSMEPGMGEPDMEMPNDGMDMGADDPFGGDSALAGGDEPLGRAAKESRRIDLQRKIKFLESKLRKAKKARK